MSRPVLYTLLAVLLLACTAVWAVIVPWKTPWMLLPILLCGGGAVAFALAADQQRLLAQYLVAGDPSYAERQDDAVCWGALLGIPGIVLGLVLALW
ncbi:MAG: hypothetical protein HY520_00195 [Candidatus Aenigmarchaeota archaeon]|nr:hypothetical protein [Candidatus Aenigmarchaeota archaeon]